MNKPFQYIVIVPSHTDNNNYTSPALKTPKIKETIIKSEEQQTVNSSLTSEKKHTCDKCQKMFSKHHVLVQHSKNCSGPQKRIFQCSNCKKNFNRRFNLFRHENVCSKSVEERIKFTCEMCKKDFSQKSNLAQHVITCGKSKLPRIPCVFSDCRGSFVRVVELVSHLSNVHEIYHEILQYNFDSRSAFLQWKEQEEENTYSYFSTYFSEKKNDFMYWYYKCQFHGADRSKKEYVRMPRTKGNARTGALCTARMFVKENMTTKLVSVRYVSMHCHELKIQNLKYQPLAPSKIKKVTSLLSSGLPAKEVHNQMLSETVAKEDINIEAVGKNDLISINAVRSLEKKIKMNTMLPEDDAAAVMLKVSGMSQGNFNQILVYKHQREDFQIGPPSASDLPKINFVLGFQSKILMSNFQIFPDDGMFYLDTAYGTNDYGFLLITVAITVGGRFYPVAHFITSILDELTLRVCFESLTTLPPHLQMKSIMTNDERSFLSAGRKVFGNNYVHLFCHWRITEKWKKKLQETVKNEALRVEMYQVLWALLREELKDKFVDLCEAFCLQYGDKAGVFVEFMRKNYFKERKFPLWSNAYRKNTGLTVNKNMYIDTFHNILKSKYLDDGPCKRIDTLLSTLEKAEGYYLEQLRRHSDRLDYFPRMSVRHERGMKIPDQEVSLVSENIWNVVSQTNPWTAYLVSRIRDDCADEFCVTGCMELSCTGLCIHMYTCKCSDLSPLCKHIHKVHQMVSASLLDNSSSVELDENAKVMACESAPGDDEDEVDKARLKCIQELNAVLKFLTEDCGKLELYHHTCSVMSRLRREFEDSAKKRSEETVDEERTSEPVGLPNCWPDQEKLAVVQVDPIAENCFSEVEVTATELSDSASFTDKLRDHNYTFGVEGNFQ